MKKTAEIIGGVRVQVGVVIDQKKGGGGVAAVEVWSIAACGCRWGWCKIHAALKEGL